MGEFDLESQSLHPTPRPRQPAKQEAPEPGQPVEDGRAAERAGHLVGAIIVAGAPPGAVRVIGVGWLQ